MQMMLAKPGGCWAQPHWAIHHELAPLRRSNLEVKKKRRLSIPMFPKLLPVPGGQNPAGSQQTPEPEAPPASQSL